jgi:CDP-glycerol glycerophosphotransferase (TagB/SpsB family)
MPDNSKPLRIAILINYFFTLRDFLFSPVWQEMAKHPDVEFLLLASDWDISSYVTGLDIDNIIPVSMPQPAYNADSPSLKNANIKTRWLQLFNKLDGKYLFQALLHRFTATHNLSHFHIRRGRSKKEKELHRVFYNYKMGEAAGFPFPQSKLLYRLVYEAHHGFLNIPHDNDIALIRNLDPDLFVFGRLHYKPTAYWVNAIKQLDIPMIGMVSSWDHTTVQGATPRGMSGYIVASKRMKDELSELHGIPREHIRQIGKPQMDIFCDPSTPIKRAEFLKMLSIPPHHRLITLATNTRGLNEHEISIARKLAEDFSRGHYGDATLLIRNHPQDRDWETNFLPLANQPYVAVVNAFPAEMGIDAKGYRDQIILANLMSHSDIVIQSRGSIALDAIAFDTPVISLAFDGDLVRQPNDSFLLEYEYEHYKPLVVAEGTWMVGNYPELDHAIQTYLANPTTHAEGRQRILKEQIDPLDGKVSQRLVEYLVESVKNARGGKLPEGNWQYSGLGDTTWASRQICAAADYVKNSEEQASSP